LLVSFNLLTYNHKKPQSENKLK